MRTKPVGARWIPMLATCVVAVTACGSGVSEVPTTPADGQTTATAHGDTSAPGGETPPPSRTGAPQTCPSTYAEAGTLRIDCLAGALPPPIARGCQYAEGTCFCGDVRQCGGAERPPTPPLWQCIRADEPPCPDYP